MPTATSVRRKKNKTSPRPQDSEPSYVLVTTAAPPPPPDPATLPMNYDGRGRAQGMRYQREKLYAWSMSSRFFEWLVLLAAQQRVPMDDCLSRLENLAGLLEVHLMARVTWPHLMPTEEVDDDGAPVGGIVIPQTIQEAEDAGLTVEMNRRNHNLPAATLPGCHGTPPEGGECQKLRRFGEKYCPACRKRELQRMRQGG